MSETDTRLREALSHMFETAQGNSKTHLEISAAELANAAEIEGKTESVSQDAATKVLRDSLGQADSFENGIACFSLPR